MIVKCIKQYPDNTIYPIDITVGQIYIAEIDERYPNYYCVKNNYDSICLYKAERFVDVTREEKLERILK